MIKAGKLLPLVPAALVLAAMILPWGCANTTDAPSGGPKDTLAPVLKNVVPFPGTVNVPVKNTKLRFTFDEYVKVKDAASIFLSPPLEKRPKAVIKGKSVEVSFESPLDSGITYTMDLTGAIVDNNEGNPFPGFTLVFSTGSSIDSMCVTGTVQDCNTLLPIKGATVLMHTDLSDSAVLKKRPVAAAKTDDWGFFSIRNIKDTVYRVYAIKDVNNDNIYQPESESIAFLDSLFRPSVVINDTLYEFRKFDMKDTALCLARKSELELNVFREKPSKQYIVKKERVGLRTAFITFMAPDARIHSLHMRDYPDSAVITQFNPQKDSMEIWVNDQRRNMPDTLFLTVNYDKTDSTGTLVPTDELIKLSIGKELRAQLQKSEREPKHEDTLAVMKTKADPTSIEHDGFVFEFQYPLIQEGWDSLRFRMVNPRQQESIGSVSVSRDSTNLRVYRVVPSEPFQVGYDYFLKIPHRVFRDINGYYTDSTEIKVTLPTDEKLSSISLNLTQVHEKYIIELLNEKRNSVLSRRIVDNDGTVLFPYMKAGTYCIRITEDRNRNNIVDTGSLLEHRQAEKVKYFKVEDKIMINVLERAEMVWDVDMEELFR